MKISQEPPPRIQTSRFSALIRLAIEDRRRLLVAAIAGEALSLSVLHHLWNLWGLPWDKQALAALFLGPMLALGISIGLLPVWEECAAIRRKRWVQFVLPAFVIAAGLSGRLFVMPEVRHELTIAPLFGADGDEIVIREIRGAYGKTIPLADFANVDGWVLHAGNLISATPGTEAIRYSFRGPIGEQIRVSFITSSQGGVARVALDGRRLDINLRGADGNETRARIDTQYQWGALNFLTLPLLAIIDTLAGLSLLALVWLAHEIGQHKSRNDALPRGLAAPSHRLGIIFVCSAALGLHTFSFLAVPLRVPKDGPSYLQGAVHWMEFHNLDGASSTRGPGTTFFFAPALRIFGRNPWGVKLVLHALAFACVPLAYLLAWQLQRRIWVAVAAGLATALSPDLYAFSNFVLSEVPHVFALLLFCSLLLAALRSLSLGWMMASLLAGSLAVLVRPDNIVALGIGMAALILAVLRPAACGSNAVRRAASRAVMIRDLALALLVAALPLAVWSAHNARLHNFFGISDYAGAVLYDGWIYYGESAGIKIIDHDSAAVRQINEVQPILARHGTRPPTSWTAYDALLKGGYGSTHAFSLLGQAATDSIRSHAPEAFQLLILKLQQAPHPLPTTPASVLATEPADLSAVLTSRYFDAEVGLVQSFGRLQDRINGRLYEYYGQVYAVWFGFCLIMLWLSSYRSPELVWLPVVVITLNALLLPIVVGIASWRYLIPGAIMLAPIALAGLDTLGRFGLHYLGRAGITASGLQ